MKYNKAYEGESFEKYMEYLDSIKEKLPKDVFGFVSDPGRHDFSEQSLHDAWLKSFNCSSNFELGSTGITLVLTSADLTREFKFSFQGVSRFRISQQMPDMYRDLITYEIGIEPDCNEAEQMVFRAIFAGDDNGIEIYSEQIDINECIKKKSVSTA